MDKVKETARKGLEKVTKMDEEPLQESNKDMPQTAAPSQGQRTDMTGGVDPHLAKSSHASDPTRMTGKSSMGQPTNKPFP